MGGTALSAEDKVLVGPDAVFAGKGGLVEIGRIVISEKSKPRIGVIGDIGKNNLIVIILQCD